MNRSGKAAKPGRPASADAEPLPVTPAPVGEPRPFAPTPERIAADADRLRRSGLFDGGATRN